MEEPSLVSDEESLEKTEAVSHIEEDPGHLPTSRSSREDPAIRIRLELDFPPLNHTATVEQAMEDETAGAVVKAIRDHLTPALLLAAGYHPDTVRNATMPEDER